MSRRGDPRLELYLLRHADAGDPLAWDGDDADRPLSPKGERQAAALAAHLSARGFRPGAILTSPKARARRTAEIVGGALAIEPLVVAELAGPFTAGDVDRMLDGAGEPERPVLVGHDPDFSALASQLVGAPGLTLKKGALARIDLGGRVAEGRGVLRWLLPPDAVTPARERQPER